MASVIESITGEFKRYRALAEAALAQLSDDQLAVSPPGGGNSIATICWHIAGNLRSRFTDFFTTDGEKPWRNREEEFQARAVTMRELLTHWEAGWKELQATLALLTDADLTRSVTIRGQAHHVDEALLRALAHISYHVGQVVYAAKALRGAAWKYLSIPPGQSAAFNAARPTQRPDEQIARLRAT